MAEISCLNLTYKSPTEDIEQCMGVNSNGTVNIKYTLKSLQNLLQENLNVVNKLIEKADHVTDIVPIGYGLVEVKINSTIVLKNLMDNKIIIQPNIDNEYQDDIIDDLNIYIDNEETDADRLAIINNLVNSGELPDILKNPNDESDSGSESESDDLIADEKNTKSIINKYSSFLNTEEYSEEINSSDEDADEDYHSN